MRQIQTRGRRTVVWASLLAMTAPGCLFKLKHQDASASPRHVDPGPWAGPLAQKHAGKVVFSSAPIPMDGSDDSAAFTTYTLGDPLFMRFWATDAPVNLQPCTTRSLSGSATRQVELRADVNHEGDGKPVKDLPSFGSYAISDELATKRNMKSLAHELERAFTSPSTFGAADDDAAVRRFNSYVIPKLHDGTNTLRIVVALACLAKPERTVMAEGTLTIAVPAGAKAAYLANYGTKLQPSPHPENADLAREIVAVMKKKPDWSNEVILGASVTSEAWQPVRNRDTGVLIAYEIEALVFVRLKTEQDPENCRAFDMAYRRDPAGGTLYYWGTGHPTFIPCAAAPH